MIAELIIVKLLKKKGYCVFKQEDVEGLKWTTKISLTLESTRQDIINFLAKEL